MSPNKERALVATLAVLGGVAFFFYYFGHGDDRKMSEMAAAYGDFDRAVSELSTGPGPDAEKRADEALAVLRTRAAMRLSSLTKNDAELMSQAREVTELAGNELESRKGFSRANDNKYREADELARASAELAGKRRAAWDRYRDLAGQGSDR